MSKALAYIGIICALYGAKEIYQGVTGPGSVSDGLHALGLAGLMAVLFVVARRFE